MLFKNPVVFFGLMLIAMTPTTIFQIFVAGNFTVNTLAHLIETVLCYVVQGVTAYGIYCVLRKQTVTLGESISRSMTRIVPLIIASILTGVGIAIGLLFLFVPGVILVSIWAVAIPVCIIENLGPIESLQRSVSLTSGYRWPIFALMTISVLASVLAVFVVKTVFSGGTGVVVASAIVIVVIQAFINVMVIIIYDDLRRLKENVAFGRLAKVFD